MELEGTLENSWLWKPVNGLWLVPSHSACFPFAGLCINIEVFLSAHTEQRARQSLQFLSIFPYYTAALGRQAIIVVFAECCPRRYSRTRRQQSDPRGCTNDPNCSTLAFRCSILTKHTLIVCGKEFSTHLLDLACCNFFLFPQMKFKLRGSPFWHSWVHPKCSADDAG